MKFLFALFTLAIGPASSIHSSRHRRMAEEPVAGVAKPDVSGPYVPTAAPRDNIFADISKDERKDVLRFLKSQRNITV